MRLRALILSLLLCLLLLGAPAFAAEEIHALETAVAEAPHEAGGHESEGLPQFDTSRFASQGFWLFFTFLITYVLMSRMALPQVTRVLEGREQKISSDLAAAKNKNERAKLLTAEVEARLAKARQEVQNAVRRAGEENAALAAKKLSEQSAALNAKLKQSEAVILEAKETARAALASEAEAVVAEIVKNVAGLSIPTADAKSAIAKAGGA